MKLSDLNILDIGHTIQLAGAIYAGNERVFLCFLPDEEALNQRAPKVEHLDMDAADWEKFLRQTDLLETEVTARAKDGTVSKAILRKCQRQIEQAICWRVFKRDFYRCSYCANDSTPLTVDHLVCYEEGGPSTEANLLASCRKCNKIRGNTPYEEWLKHPFYLKVSQALTPEVRQANEARVATLASIPRLDYVKSR